jgi:hypothetical protein
MTGRGLLMSIPFGIRREAKPDFLIHGMGNHKEYKPLFEQ